MLRSKPAFLGAALALSLLVPAVATATPTHVAGEVLVRYRDAAAPVPVATRRGETVDAAAARLRRDPRVATAVPNYLAHASGLEPDDPGYRLQWNFWDQYGIDVPDAWQMAAQRGAPGGSGVTVAVLDTGVAYRKFARYRRAPDLERFVPGRDFVDDDRFPFDLNGHGTHVAGTIAAATGNGIGTAGIAYEARIMPVRTLDEQGDGDARTISRGIRYAVAHGADVINLSLEFPASVGARQLPDLMAALRLAYREGIVVVAVAGNGRGTRVPYPGRAPHVIAVGATTRTGCRASYSNQSPDVDVVAPGGGKDAEPGADGWDATHCRPGAAPSSIYQQTFASELDRDSFSLPTGYYGTSMATPHVTGIAALLLGTRRLGGHPSPDAVEQRIEQTARDAGAPGFDPAYGNGLVDAAAALR